MRPPEELSIATEAETRKEFGAVGLDCVIRHPTVDWNWPRSCLTGIAIIYCVLAQAHRPLWLDEACTYWTIQASAIDLLHGVRTDGTPPLYFLMVAAVTHLAGTSEFALRFTSIVAAIALVPSTYIVTTRFATRRAGVIAAALTTSSPLVHYYAVQARNYEMVQLETVAVLYVTYRAIFAPTQIRWWLLLALSQAIQLWTHNYALFLLPAPAIGCLLVADRPRVSLVAKAVAASTCALIISLPYVIGAVQAAGTGVSDWITPFWRETPPAAAVLRSLEVFGFGGQYPIYLGFLGQAPSFRLLAWPTLITILAMAVGGWRQSGVRMLIGFLLVPLIAAWIYSLVRTPIYLVGRYDTIVLPVFLMLLGVGLDNAFRARAWLGVTMTLGLAAISSSTTFAADVVEEPDEVLAAEYLNLHAVSSDEIVATGQRQAIVAFYMDRAGHHRSFRSFPFETSDHPGWYSPERMLRDSDRLTREGAQLSVIFEAAAAQGHGIWVLATGPNAIDRHLYAALQGHLVIDEERSRRDIGVYFFAP
jgi:hypothetical protein